MISKSTIQEVQDRVDIEDVISDFVTLKRKGSGKYLWACCPFHDEKTPSFSVTPDKGIYKCFGCGKSGDSINFIMEHDGLNYIEAIKYLAQKYGIEIVEEEQSDEVAERQSERESLYIILNFAKDYFQDKLQNSEQGRSIGLSYFKERGFNQTAIDKFELGYSLDQWDALHKEALSKAYSDELLEKAGLIVVKPGQSPADKERRYDRFRGRAIFPIHNVSGKVVAFGARTLKTDDKPKYLNSPETEVYHKSRVLYGIYQAKNAIRQMDNCYLVEGYTDVISLHQSDIENVVASSGTSLTEDQIKLVNRFSKNITVLFDGDPAGIKASLRGIDMILASGMNVRVVVFPEGEDPDSYSQKLGTSAFKNYLKDNTTDFIKFKAGLFAEEAVHDPIKRAESIREIVNSISRIPDPVQRAVYIKESSKELRIQESTLLAELNKLLIKEKRQRTDRATQRERVMEGTLPELEKRQPVDEEALIAIQEKESVRLLLNYGIREIEEEYRLYDYLLNELEGVKFVTPVYQRILDIFKLQLAEGNVVDSQYLMANGDSEVKSEVANLVTERWELSPNWGDKYDIFVPKESDILENVVFTNVLRLKFRVIQKLITENLEKLKSESDPDKEEGLFHIHNELKKYEMELAKALGVVVTR